ncbi:acylneuraminate cytidylyltransferase family protein [Dyadobacter crusticola]|uniref:acylneuraminate cytidylyltransferase family protein n=1 Tax=Dyadobacter crusticola TaxID=292407 RepID=UPI0004E0ECB4|nr:acylneuraminate cytidylyltransferase family protein [Dyadobacter crusticola]
MKTTSRILGVIPARSGSKGIYNKNLKLLGGKPLIYYTIQAALNARMLNTVIVSSDCFKILQYAQQFAGITVPFVRPKDLASDVASSFDVVKHSLDFYSKFGCTFDFVMLLQPTSPFRSADLIDRAAQYMIASGADSLITVRKIPARFHPSWAFQAGEDGLHKVVENSGQLISRRQDLPDNYYRDGKIYMAKTALIETGTLLGGKIASLLTEDEPDINIDTFSDWEMAQHHIHLWKNLQKESC